MTTLQIKLNGIQYWMDLRTNGIVMSDELGGPPPKETMDKVHASVIKGLLSLSKENDCDCPTRQADRDCNELNKPKDKQ